MGSSTAERLATSLLEEHGHLETFEVDPLDPRASDLLAKALEAYGCKVERSEFSTLLVVTCPQIVN